jgi:uncharacterized protein (DUF2236 family)
MGVARVTEVGGAVGARLAALPGWAIGLIVEPVRADVGRQVRRSLGIPEPRTLRAMDPDEAYLPPDSVTRRVHADLPSMMIGGLAALLLQTLHPLAMAGVAQHSNYRDDALGRLRRTAEFVGTTTYGTKSEARRIIERVKDVHLPVRGIAPDGRPYSASDPELLTWVHTAEMYSFLAAARRYGTVQLDAADGDSYYEETAKVAYELGATWVPTSSEQVDAYFRRIRPELYAGAQALAARDFLLRGVGRKPEDRLVHGLLVTAAIGLLPGWARSELRLPAIPVVESVTIAPVARIVCAGMRWAVTARPRTSRSNDAGNDAGDAVPAGQGQEGRMPQDPAQA